jgi:DNA-directed RNA polymerase subunit M/transcription elongation factor TFIIS
MTEDERAKTAPSGRLLCPRCGGQTNFHAEKIDRRADPSDADASLDGFLAQFHTCPACKYVLERPLPG